MSDLTPRSGKRMTRSQREGRAFSLVLASGGGAVASAVLAVLWIAGVTGFGLFFLAAAFTAVSWFLLRRSLGR
jgi:hypothetical protein